MNTHRIVALLFAIMLPACSTVAQEQTFRTERLTLKAERVAGGLEHPWALEFLPDGALLVTERAGRLRLVEDGNISEPLGGVPEVAAYGQGGLPDVALAPDFETGGHIYLTFSEPGRRNVSGTAVARARLVREQGGARLTDVETIFTMPAKTHAGSHFGSRIAFHPDGTLFFAIGDRGEPDRAQAEGDHAGAVLRINPDGSVPDDNPYARGGAHLPEIWSKGHRNAQGIVYDPLTRSILTAEHGARGGDEINRPEPGLNYGWPRITYGRDYSGASIGSGTAAEGYEQPLHYWDPSIAPSSIVVYSGAMFPEWEGNLLVGALSQQLIARLERDRDGTIRRQEQMIQTGVGRIRDLAIAPDGSVFLLTDARDGAVIRLSRAD